SCRLQHCTAHEGVCAEDGHTACSACLAPCGSCGRVVCNRHAEQSGADAPKGSRRLCTACLKYCEGGTNEPVGVDEGAECATCAQLVAIADPPEEVVTAARAVTGGALPKASRAWRMARDRSHLVVEVDLGLKRKAVFTLRHGTTAPESVVKHSLLGSKRRT